MDIPPLLGALITAAAAAAAAAFAAAAAAAGETPTPTSPSALPASTAGPSPDVCDTERPPMGTCRARQSSPEFFALRADATTGMAASTTGRGPRAPHETAPDIELKPGKHSLNKNHKQAFTEATW